MTEELEYNAYVFDNNLPNPAAESVLRMFCEGVFYNQVGIMNAWNLKTSEEELILVGVQLDEDGKPECFPIAKVLAAEDVPNYLSPDGKGGWFDPQDAVEKAAAKENMKDMRQPEVEETNEPV